MKLYSLALSPFAARCRMVIYAKGLDIEIAEPPGGVQSDAYAAINPLQKVPCLETDGGSIPESTVIMNYLEDHFPQPSLQADTPMGRVKVSLIERIADLYVIDPMYPLFPQLQAEYPDRGVVNSQWERIRWGLKQIEHYMTGESLYAVGRHLTLADCVLAPVLLLMLRTLPRLGIDDVFWHLPKLQAYHNGIEEDPHVKRVLDEIRAAFPASA